MYNEQEIIDGCLRGERKMQKLLYEKYSSTMFAICLRYTKNRDEAADVLQDGFIKVFTKMDQFSREHSFEGWMKRIFVNTALTHYKLNLKHNRNEDIDEIYESDITDRDTGSTDCEYSREELLGVVQDLSEGYRVVFNLFAIEGYKHKEIAEMLGIDENTSKSQFHRARKTIQQKLKEISSVKIQHYEQ